MRRRRTNPLAAGDKLIAAPRIIHVTSETMKHGRRLWISTSRGATSVSFTCWAGLRHVGALCHDRLLCGLKADRSCSTPTKLPSSLLHLHAWWEEVIFTSPEKKLVLQMKNKESVRNKLLRSETSLENVSTEKCLVDYRSQRTSTNTEIQTAQSLQLN